MRSSEEILGTTAGLELLEKLRSSAAFVHWVGQLEVVAPCDLSCGTENREGWLAHVIQGSLRDPEPVETLTKSQRVQKGQRIGKLCRELAEELHFFTDERFGMQWPFQPDLDGAALTIAEAYGEFHQLDAADPDERIHFARFAIYYALMSHMDQILGALADGAEFLGSVDSQLKKPNDPNARRLLFIRRLTSYFFRDFRRPFRLATLELASIFFDCGDLTEADISKLAPVRPQSKKATKKRG